MLMRKFFSCTTVAPAVRAMPPEWAIVPAKVPTRRRPEVIGKRRPAAVAVPGAITDGVTPSEVRALAVPASRPSVVPPPDSSTWEGVALRSTRPMLTPPGRSVPNAALRAAAAAGVRFACARTTQVSMPPEPRRMTLAPERSMPASGMRAEPTAAVRTGREAAVLTMKLVRRTVVPWAENARPPEWVTRPTAVAGSIAPPVIGKDTRRPFAVAGPTGATDSPASVSTPAVAALRWRAVVPPATGTSAARAAGAPMTAPAARVAASAPRRRPVIADDTRFLLWWITRRYPSGGP